MKPLARGAMARVIDQLSTTRQGLTHGFFRLAKDPPFTDGETEALEALRRPRKQQGQDLVLGLLDSQTGSL